MRFRFWIGLAAVAVIAIGSVAVALAVRANDNSDFHTMQQSEATRAAHQAEAVAGLSVGELSNAAAFFQVEKNVSAHEFDVIARSLLDEGALTTAAFIQRVPAAARSRFERTHGFRIVEHGGLAGRLVRAADAPAYFPLTYAVADQSTQRGLGYNLATDPLRSPYLRRARDTGEPAATGIVPLLLGGMGVTVFRPVYRDGAPIADGRPAARCPDRILRRQLQGRGHRRRGGRRRLASPTRSSCGSASDPSSGPGANSRTRPGRRCGSLTAPGCWSSATRTGPTSACRWCLPESASPSPPCSPP